MEKLAKHACGQLQFFKKDGTEGSVFPLDANQEYSIGYDSQATIRLKMVKNTPKSILCVVAVDAAGIAKLINKEVTYPIKVNDNDLYDAQYLFPNDTFFVANKKIRYENDAITQEDITRSTSNNNVKRSRIPLRRSLTSATFKEQKLSSAVKRKRSSSLLGDSEGIKIVPSVFKSLKGSKTPHVQRWSESWNVAEVEKKNLRTPMKLHTSEKTPRSGMNRQLKSPRSVQLKKNSSRIHLIRRSVGPKLKTPVNQAARNKVIKSNLVSKKTRKSESSSSSSGDTRAGFNVSPYVNNRGDLCTPPNNTSAIEVGSTPLPSIKKRRFEKSANRKDSLCLDFAETKTPKSSFKMRNSSAMKDRKSSLSKTPVSLIKSRKSLLMDHNPENTSDSECLQMSSSTPPKKSRKSLMTRTTLPTDETPKCLSPIVATSELSNVSLDSFVTVRKPFRKLNETFSEGEFLVSPSKDSPFSGKEEKEFGHSSRETPNELSPAITVNTGKKSGSQFFENRLRKTSSCRSSTARNKSSYSLGTIIPGKSKSSEFYITVVDSNDKMRTSFKHNSTSPVAIFSDKVMIRTSSRSKVSLYNVLSQENLTLVGSSLEVSYDGLPRSHCALEDACSENSKNGSSLTSKNSDPSRRTSSSSSTEKLRVQPSRSEFSTSKNLFGEHSSPTEDKISPSKLSQHSQPFANSSLTNVSPKQKQRGSRSIYSSSMNESAEQFPSKPEYFFSEVSPKGYKSRSLSIGRKSESAKKQKSFTSESLASDEKNISSEFSGYDDSTNTTPKQILEETDNLPEENSSISKSLCRKPSSSVLRGKLSLPESLSRDKKKRASMNIKRLHCSLVERLQREKYRNSFGRQLCERSSSRTKSVRQFSFPLPKGDFKQSDECPQEEQLFSEKEEDKCDRACKSETPTRSYSNLEEDELSSEEDSSVRQLTLILSDGAIDQESEDVSDELQQTQHNLHKSAEDLNILTSSPKVNIDTTSYSEPQKKRRKSKRRSLPTNYHSNQENVPVHYNLSFENNDVDSSSLLETKGSSSFCYEKPSYNDENFESAHADITSAHSSLNQSKLSQPEVIQTPENDLQDVQNTKRTRAASKLMHTPKVRISPVNDFADVKGVRQLLRRPGAINGPRNDLTDVRGVRKLMNMCKVRPPVNDLTDVRGIRNLMKTPKDVREPKNDLTDVRGVRKLMKTPKNVREPKNDLTDVRGVRKLMKTPKDVREPKNDLTDVRGVRKLMTTPGQSKGPRNDLRDVRGVRKLLSTPNNLSSPLNDLTDVRDVKKLFGTPKIRRSPKNELSNFTGVRKLMETPHARKEPTNDLSNFYGIHKLMKSPKQKRSLNLSGLNELMASPVSCEVENSQKVNTASLISPAESVEALEVHKEENVIDPNTTLSDFDTLLNKKPIRTYRGKSESPVKSKFVDAPRSSDITGNHVQPDVAKWVKEQGRYLQGMENNTESEYGGLESKVELKDNQEPVRQKPRIKEKKVTETNSNVDECVSDTRPIRNRKVLKNQQLDNIAPVRQSPRIRAATQKHIELEGDKEHVQKVEFTKKKRLFKNQSENEAVDNTEKEKKTKQGEAVRNDIQGVLSPLIECKTELIDDTGPIAQSTPTRRTHKIKLIEEDNLKAADECIQEVKTTRSRVTKKQQANKSVASSSKIKREMEVEQDEMESHVTDFQNTLVECKTDIPSNEDQIVTTRGRVLRGRRKGKQDHQINLKGVDDDKHVLEVKDTRSKKILRNEETKVIAGDSETIETNKNIQDIPLEHDVESTDNKVQELLVNTNGKKTTKDHSPKNANTSETKEQTERTIRMLRSKVHKQEDTKSVTTSNNSAEKNIRSNQTSKRSTRKGKNEEATETVIEIDENHTNPPSKRPTRKGKKEEVIETVIEIDENHTNPPSKKPTRKGKKEEVIETVIEIDENHTNPPSKRPTRKVKKEEAIETVIEIDEDHTNPPSKRPTRKGKKEEAMETVIEMNDDHVETTKRTTRREKNKEVNDSVIAINDDQEEDNKRLKHKGKKYEAKVKVIVTDRDQIHDIPKSTEVATHETSSLVGLRTLRTRTQKKEATEKENQNNDGPTELQEAKKVTFESPVVRKSNRTPKKSKRISDELYECDVDKKFKKTKRELHTIQDEENSPAAKPVTRQSKRTRK